MREREGSGAPPTAPVRAAQVQIITVAHHRRYHRGRIREVHRCLLMIVSVVRGVSWARCLASRRLAASLNKGMVVVGMDISNSNTRHSSSSMDMVVLLSRSMGILLNKGILHRVDIILLVLGMAGMVLALDTDIRLNNSNNRVRPVAEEWVQWGLLR
jgi:hypothetical protein